MLFRDIPGNNEIKQKLINGVVNGRIAHAQLFCGPSGNAKLALALSYARYVNCQSKLPTDSCGSCLSCKKYNNLEHPDLHLVFPVIKTTKIKNTISDHYLSEWRNLVIDNAYLSVHDWAEEYKGENKMGQTGMIYKDQAKSISEKIKLKSYESNYKIVLIWCAELMNKDAANKLLKLIEEPPQKTLFLLTTNNKNSLLKTILSRLQITNIANFKKNDLLTYFDHLEKDQYKLVEEQAEALNYDLGSIIKLLKNQDSEITYFQLFANWMRFLYRKDVQKIVDWNEKISIIGRKNQIEFCNYSLNVIRACLIYKIGIQTNTVIKKEEKEFIKNFSPYLSNDNILNMANKLEETIFAIRRNANSKILFFNLSLECLKLLTLKSN